MKVFTREIFAPRKDLKLDGLKSLREYYHAKIKPLFPSCIPIRFVITKTDNKGFYCEIDFVALKKSDRELFWQEECSLFEYRKRTNECTRDFVAVLMIPTGIGAELGGHCGDGNAVARLIASSCDTLITHPNVVNASDINEMRENTLYVEGSILTRLFMGTIGIQPVRANRILMLMDKNKDTFFNDEVINAVSSARVTLGIDCDVVQMESIIKSRPYYSKAGRAVGEIERLENLFKIIERYKAKYDAIGLSTIMKVPKHIKNKYFRHLHEMVNPWGGLEAMLTHSVAERFKMPCAHSPMTAHGDMHLEMDIGIVDPRKAPETASVTYLHCILKGLHKSPRITNNDEGLRAKDISCLIIPDGCIGLPVIACLEHGIPVIAVNNRNEMRSALRTLPFDKYRLYIVDNYLEAVGVMAAIRAGLTVESVMRPISMTKAYKAK